MGDGKKKKGGAQIDKTRGKHNRSSAVLYSLLLLPE